jgi:ketosteroid isomerase-like protein
MDDSAEAIVSRLAAESAIRRLISGYCDAVNRRDAEAAGALFAPDAAIRIADSPGLEGHAAITEGMRQTFALFTFMRQQCDAGLIDVEGDAARARLAVMEMTRRDGEDGLSLILGTYEDDYRRLDGGWRFHRRRFTVQIRTRLAVTKLQQFPDLVPLFGLVPQ